MWTFLRGRENENHVLPSGNFTVQLPVENITSLGVISSSTNLEISRKLVYESYESKMDENCNPEDTDASEVYDSDVFKVVFVSNIPKKERQHLSMEKTEQCLTCIKNNWDWIQKMVTC